MSTQAKTWYAPHLRWVAACIDVSPKIKKAHSNGLKNAFVSDVQSLAPEVLASTAGTFDAVFSNAALHWASRDPAGVLRGVKQALKPGGRFVGEMGGFSNIVGVRGPLLAAVKRRGVDPKSVDPWYFPNVGEYKHVSVAFHPTHGSSLMLIVDSCSSPTGSQSKTFLSTLALPHSSVH